MATVKDPQRADAPSTLLRAACILFPPNAAGARFRVDLARGEATESSSWTAWIGDVASLPDESGWRGNAALIEWDAAARALTVRTSLSGCPTIFLVQLDGWVGITTSPKFLTEMGLSLRADPRGILDLCSAGYPVDGHTLVLGVSVIPAGVRLTIRAGAEPRIVDRWQPDTSRTFSTLDEYASVQSARFADVMAALPVERTLLSLSGGLDTRSVFAGLVHRGAQVRCFTVSGIRPTLDAVLARDICRAYGLSHTIVPLGPDFVADVWNLSARASLLSSGFTSLGSAPQVYCYDHLGIDSSSVVLSGFLGNQVGRGATEGLTQRPTDLGILSPEVTGSAQRGESGPWFARGLIGEGQFDRRFLIQEENLYASMGAYWVGASRATQRSPYSDAILLANAVAIPRVVPQEGKGRWSIDPRIPELKKRFFGTGEASFQRRYIMSVGGAVAKQSINYGWTASGQLSPRGLARGARAFLEDALDAASRRLRAAEVLYNASRLRGFATHLQPAEWVRAMREPLLDELSSEAVRSCGLIDVAKSKAAAESYFVGGSARPDTVIALVDVLLARKNFGLTVA